MNQSFDKIHDKLLLQLSGIQAKTILHSEDYILSLFRFQYKYNTIYKQYCNNLGVYEKDIVKIDEIPFLPISAFKKHVVKTGNFEAEEIFRSSGTSLSKRSSHHVRHLKSYLKNSESIWSNQFESVENYCILALLPGYLERDGSSLISMTNYFVSKSKYDISGFYLRNHDSLASKLNTCLAQNIPTILFGVTYALLDFTEQYQIAFPGLIVIETGGMKGQRKEMTRSELHFKIKKSFNVPKVYSEYGMTELLSQAYTTGGSTFLSNPLLKVYTYQINDPLQPEKPGKPGIISVIDLANIDSCAFIQTEDIGIRYENGDFEILGRLEAADMRGCNLLLEETGFI
jgi:hypothetical protein